MERRISQRELRNNSGQVMRAVDDGETFVVTRNGVPTAELRPLRRRLAVRTSEVLASAAGLPRIDATAFRAELDEVLDQSLQ